MRLFGWQFLGLDEIIRVVVLSLGWDYLGGIFTAGRTSFGWQFDGWDENIWMAVLRLR